MAGLRSSFLAPAHPPPHMTIELHKILKLVISEAPEGQLLRIQLSVLLNIFLLFILLFLGSIRRHVRFGPLLKCATKIIYLLIPFSITYIMGLMHNASTLHVLYPVWACALVYAYGGVVTMTACDLSDNEETLRYFWRTFPLIFWTLWLGMMVFDNEKFSTMLVITVGMFLVLASINTFGTLVAFHRASKSKGLPRVVEPIVKYMRDGRDVHDENTAKPEIMKGYRYVVWGDPLPGEDDSGIITTENIWDSVGKKCLGNICDGRRRLRDLCLSYAFFRLLQRRFAGFPLHESSKSKTRRFILEGLLPNFWDQSASEVQLKLDPISRELRFVENEQSQVRMKLAPADRVFRIIEVELDFLFDFFYTKSHVCSSYRFGDVWRHLLHVVLLSVFGTIGISRIVPKSIGDFRIELHGHRPEVGVTRIVIMIFCLLELGKLGMVFFSNRKMVLLLCRATTNEGTWITETIIFFIWRIREWLSSRFVYLFKPWQRKLGQYSFLESYGQVPILSQKPFTLLSLLLKVPRIGQKGDFSVQLSTQVKQAIVSSLIENQLKLSRGTSAIARYHLGGQILEASLLLELDADFILVWHIATSVCEFLHPPKNNNNDNFLVSTQLSKYCAYLLTFSPEILPGHPYTTEDLFDKAVKCASSYKVGSNIRERCKDLITMYNNQGGLGRDDNIVVRGVALAAETLIPQIKRNPEQGWKILAEFWAELLVYLSPSDNVVVHGEYLARGGEFITHLWALLTHAGVLTRNSCMNV